MTVRGQLNDRGQVVVASADRFDATVSRCIETSAGRWRFSVYAKDSSGQLTAASFRVVLLRGVNEATSEPTRH